jgi:RNA polymerase sigma-70 factor (ECF subfamily)
MTQKQKQSQSSRVGQLFVDRRSRLQAFFHRRVRSSDSTSDLTQEAFTRVLRADSSQAIANPEAYLFTVAANLVREHAMLNQRFADASDVDDPALEAELYDWPDMDSSLDNTERQRVLLSVLDELSPKAKAAVVLQFRDGLTYREIGERLGVSSHMVKKYLSNALRHCRERLAARRDLL